MEEREAEKIVKIEYTRSRHDLSSFVSYYEGYAVILEELDELWTQIKEADYPGRRTNIRDSAAKTAAMAFRFLINLC